MGFLQSAVVFLCLRAQEEGSVVSGTANDPSTRMNTWQDRRYFGMLRSDGLLGNIIQHTRITKVLRFGVMFAVLNTSALARGLGCKCQKRYNVLQKG
jgi:hypothetical protein